jgi:diguanylate cyclase (GGDEF)-like protein/putative nucleotidyltransferase with HDIG domain
MTETIRGRYLLVLIAFAVVPALLIGLLVWQNARNAIETRVKAQLTSVADLEKQQIAGWLTDREADVKLLADNFLNEEHLTVILDPDADPELRSAFARFITQNLNSIRENRRGYDEIAFLSRTGRVVLSTDSENVGKEYGDLRVFRETMSSESGAATIDIHRAADRGKIQMAFGHIMRLVDLETNRVLPEVNGVAIIRVNMDETIYPLIRAWPGMRETGETLIVRREGEDTLFLNPLRFGSDPPLTLRVPRGSEIAQTAQLASAGNEGIVQSVDYRGVRVLAAYRHIPGVDWGFVAKEDLSQAFAPIRRLTQQLLLITLAVFLIAVFVAVVSAGELTGSLRRLASAADAVEKGDLKTEISISGNDEVAQLAGAFNSMVSSIAENEAQLRANSEELSALFHLSQSLLGTIDVDETLKLALRRAMDGTATEAGAVLLLNPGTNELLVRKQTGLPRELVGKRFPVDAKSAPGYAILRKEPIWSSDIQGERTFRVPPPIERAGVRANLAVPMLIDGRAIGALVVDSFSNREFDSGHVSVARAIANQTAIALERARLFNDLSDSYDRTLDSLVAALDARDKETEGHSRRVVAFTLALAGKLRVTQAELPTVRRGALLHDIGKIGVPDAILHKPGPLTEDEWKIMRKHPEWGAGILRGIPFLESAVKVLLAHHERWDGGGYPRGLKGEEIPLGARTFALADTLDAITSDRPYRAARSFSSAREEIARGRGSQFDPAVVDAFLGVPEQEWAILRSESIDPEPVSQEAIATLSESYGSPSAAKHLERIINAVSCSLDFRNVLEEAVRVAVEDLGAAAAGLFLYDRETDTLALAAERDLPEAFRERFQRFPVEGFHNEMVLRDARLNVFGSVSEVSEFVELGLPQRVPRLGQYACIPIRRGEQVEGVLGVLQYEGTLFDEETLRIYELIGLHIGIALKNAAEYEDLHHRATTDGLTGAYNRAYFDDFIASELARARRYDHTLSVLMLDIDRFKGFNDSHGHQAGDEALRTMVSVMQSSVRNIDLISRYGGEEFSVVLPETGEPGALSVAEKFRKRLESELTAKGELTVSIGVSSFHGGEPDLTAEELVGRADQALYAAKRAGRDCVRLWNEAIASDSG